MVEERIDCSPQNFESLVNKYAPNRSVVEIEKKNSRLIGFIGKYFDEVLDLAHTSLLGGEYDNWFNHYLTRSPGELSAEGKKGISMKDIVSISMLKKED
ncbi:hypothetical protein HY212_04580 [Candidatus Pacearchaeota archaeon]|nr:hypothetical protein [Candidatus Pacearchaeota archaeon]